MFNAAEVQVRALRTSVLNNGRFCMPHPKLTPEETRPARMIHRAFDRLRQHPGQVQGSEFNEELLIKRPWDRLISYSGQTVLCVGGRGHAATLFWTERGAQLWRDEERQIISSFAEA